MDKQLAQSYAWLNRLTTIFVAVILAIGISIGIWSVYGQKAEDPYTHSVLALDGDRQNGLAIFQINCAGCHNLQAEKNVGPRLEDISKRKSSKEIIAQVISGKTPPMPKFQPGQQEMADLLSYLNQL